MDFWADHANPASKMGKRFVFTIPNYTEKDINHLQKISNDGEITEGIWYGLESAPTTGMKHIQGYVIRPVNTRPCAMQQLLHHEYEEWRILVENSPSGKNKLKLKDFKIRFTYCEIARGKHEKCIEYCWKGEQPKDEYINLGSKGPNYGKNAVIFGQAIADDRNYDKNKIDEYESAISCITEKPNLDNFIKEYPNLFFKHPAAANQLIDRFSSQNNLAAWRDIINAVKLRPWQEQLLAELQKEIHWLDPKAGEVTWIVDPEGMNGKSTFSTIVQVNHGGVKFEGTSKLDNVLHNYNGETIIMFDIERSKLAQFDYSLIEVMMRPIIYSGKFQGSHKTKPPGKAAHIVCFSNGLPNTSNSLTNARWNIMLLEKGVLTKLSLEEIAKDKFRSLLKTTDV